MNKESAEMKAEAYTVQVIRTSQSDWAANKEKYLEAVSDECKSILVDIENPDPMGYNWYEVYGIPAPGRRVLCYEGDEYPEAVGLVF